MMDVDRLDLLGQELEFVLQFEQREALELLLRGKDVFCVLPTGFGKSLKVFNGCLSMQRVLQVPCNSQLLLLSHLRKKEDNT